MTHGSSPPGNYGAWATRKMAANYISTSMQNRTRTQSLQLIRALVAALDFSAREVESSTGITSAQLFLLRQLYPGAHPSVAELAERLHVKANTVSALLSRLVAAGFAKKEKSPLDARRVVLSITPAGRRLLARAPKAAVEILLEALDAMSLREVRLLVKSLTPLVERLGIPPELAPLLFENR